MYVKKGGLLEPTNGRKSLSITDINSYKKENDSEKVLKGRKSKGKIVFFIKSFILGF